MPYGDGKGPPGGKSGRGGRMGGSRPGSGPGGNCVCPQCGHSVTHEKAQPCFSRKCPQCGTPMIRG